MGGGGEEQMGTDRHTHLSQAAGWGNAQSEGSSQQQSPVSPLKYRAEVLIPSAGCGLFNSSNLEQPNQS